MRRYELTDAAWERIKELMPPTGQPGGQWNDHRTTSSKLASEDKNVSIGFLLPR